MKDGGQNLVVRRLMRLPRGWWMAVAAAPLLFVIVFFAQPVFAQVELGDYVTRAIGWIANIFISAIGQLLLVLVAVMINIATYNDFVTARPIAIGWVIVRDLTNMFFILVLLVIAFSTMLGIQKTGDYRQALPRLLIVAVVINFSRTLVGLMIDFSQVLMLTFVNGFSAAAGGNFVTAFGINQVLNTGVANAPVKALDAVVAGVLGIINVSVAVGVVIIITAVLIGRIVYLWILTILSPLAFLMKAVPSGAATKYYGEWWSMFTSNLITGPVLAFFLWLALLVASDPSLPVVPTGQISGETLISAGIGEAFTQGNIQKLIVSVALMLGGVMIAKKIGGAGIGLGSAIADKARKTATGALRKTAAYAGRGALNVADRGIGRIAVGKGATVSGLAKTRYEQLKETGVGKAFGLNKEFNENRKGKQQIATLRAVGQHAKADLLEKGFVGDRAKQLGKSHNSAQLKELVENKKADKNDRQAALLALAEDGDDYVKGKGAEIATLVANVGGTRTFDSQIRKALKANGDVDAYRGAGDSDPIEEIQAEFRGLRPHELQKRLASSSEGVALGTNGKPKRTHAIHELNALTVGQYKTDLNDAGRAEVNKALLLAQANETDKTKKDKIIDKYNSLNGKTGLVGLSKIEEDEAALFKLEQDKKLVGGRVSAKVIGEEREKPVEVVARDIFRSGPRGVEGARDQFDYLDRLQTVTAAGALPPANGVAAINTLQTSLLADAGTAPTKNYDAAGRQMTREDVVKASQAYQDLESAKQAFIAGSTKGVDKFIQSVKLQFQQAANEGLGTGKFSQKELAESERLNKQAKVGLEVGSGSLDTALAEVENERRVQMVKEGISQIRTALKNLGQLRTSSPEVQKRIDDLKENLKTLNDAETIEAAQVAQIEAIKKKLTDLKKQV